MGETMIAQLAQCAKSILAGRANAHGCVWLHHDSGATGQARAINHVSHEIQTGLEQQTVITGKQLLIHQLLHLTGEEKGEKHEEFVHISDLAI